MAVRSTTNTRSLATNRLSIQNIPASVNTTTTTSVITLTKNSGLPLTNTSANSTYSIAGWWNIADQSVQHTFYAEGNTGSTVQFLHISTEAANDTRIRVFLRNDANTILINDIRSTARLNASRWNHIVFTNNAGTCRLYINGVEDATSTSGSYNYAPAGTTTLNTSTIAGLTRTTTVNGLLGKSSSVQLFNTALLPQQVQMVMNGQLTGNVGNYPLTEGAGSIAYDSSGNGNNGTITAGTYVLDTPTKKRQAVGGNLVYNSDFEYAPPFTAATNVDGRWIDGTAGGSLGTVVGIFGWGTAKFAGSGTASFDTTVKRSGNASIKVSTTAVASRIAANSVGVASSTGIKLAAIPAIPSTSYTISGWMKTNYVSGDSNNGATIQVNAADGTGTYTNTPYSSSSVKVTQDWTYYTSTFTTSAATRYLYISLDINGNTGTATLIMDAWLDDIQLYPTVNSVRGSV